MISCHLGKVMINPEHFILAVWGKVMINPEHFISGRLGKSHDESLANGNEFILSMIYHDFSKWQESVELIHKGFTK